MSRNPVPPKEGEDWDKAAAMAKAGAPWRHISREAGISEHRLKSRLKPGFREEWRSKMGFRRLDERTATTPGNRQVERKLLTPEEEARAFASVPKDTRNFTARLCGDPLPGRSVLDKLKAAKAEVDA